MNAPLPHWLSINKGDPMEALTDLFSATEASLYALHDTDELSDSCYLPMITALAHDMKEAKEFIGGLDITERKSDGADTAPPAAADNDAGAKDAGDDDDQGGDGGADIDYESGPPAGPVTDPIPVGPGVIARHPERDLTEAETEAECCYKILASLRMLERELADLPDDVVDGDNDPAHTWARFRRMFWVMKPQMEDLFEALNEGHEELVAELYAGASVLEQEISQSNGEFGDETDLGNFRTLFALVQPAMIERAESLLGMAQS